MSDFFTKYPVLTQALYHTTPVSESNGYLSFLLIDSSSGRPEQMTLAASWNPQQFIGFYLFLKEVPADLEDFANEMYARLAPLNPEHTGFVWISLSGQGQGAVVSELEILEVDAEGGIQNDLTLSFGNYGLPFIKGWPIQLSGGLTTGFLGFLFSYPTSLAASPAQAGKVVHLPFDGLARGCLQSQATIGDFSEDEETGWNVGLRYFVESTSNGLEDTIISQYYPIFNLDKELRLLFNLCWDPVDPLNPVRTFLAFSATSFYLRPAENGEYDYQLEAGPVPLLLPTWFITDYGKQVYFMPINDPAQTSSPAKLVFASLTNDPDASIKEQAFYLTPAGDFELAVLPLLEEVKRYYIIGGLSGTETIGFKSRYANGSGDVLHFSSAKPAFAPAFPLNTGFEKEALQGRGQPESKTRGPGPWVPDKEYYQSEEFQERKRRRQQSGKYTSIHQDSKEKRKGPYLAYKAGSSSSWVQAETTSGATGMTGCVSSYLNDTFTTSWVTVKSGTGVVDAPQYFSQPQDAPLYHKLDTGPVPAQADNSTATKAVTELSPADFLDYFRTPAANLSQDGQNGCQHAFPMVPLSGAIPNPKTDTFAPPDPIDFSFLRTFEDQIINPARAEAIRKIPQSSPHFLLRSAKADSLDNKGPQEETYDVEYGTSPQGLLVEIGGATYQWTKLWLAHIPPLESLFFQDLSTDLQAAFQTNQQFLVISERNGKLSGFDNRISIEDWPFVLDVPEQVTDQQYSNVLIFKFRAGSIRDLIADTRQWTAADDFNADPAAVSEWISDYIDAHLPIQSDSFTYTARNGDCLSDVARFYGLDKEILMESNPRVSEQLRRGTRLTIPMVKNNELYENFNRIVRSENWQGILALKVNIDLKQFPEEIKGLLGGIDLSKFDAHHFGIETNQVNTDSSDPTKLQMSEPSSLFGLIDYQDNTPNTGNPYDFKVTELQVLFANSAIADFKSEVILTLGQLFGEQVELQGESIQNNTIRLKGSYENHDGDTSYAFISQNDFSFASVNGVIWREMVISKAQFYTLNEEDNKVSSVFSFWGNLKFFNITKDLFKVDGDIEIFDLFSFDLLSYSGIQLLMDFQIAEAADTSPPKQFAFNPGNVSFDPSASETRAFSLYRNFPLTIQGMSYSDISASPGSRGFFLTTTPLTNSTSLQAPWYALRFDLNLGSPGELAAKANLTASLLAAWSPVRSGASPVAVYLKLPGTSGLLQMAIQSVIKLNITDLQFLSTVISADGVTIDHVGYELQFRGISASILGKTIPSGGQTNIYIFGNPDPTAPQNTLGWYMAYNKDKSASDGIAPEADTAYLRLK